MLYFALHNLYDVMLLGDSISNSLEVKALIADLDLVPGRASRNVFLFTHSYKRFLSDFSVEARRELDCPLLNYYHYALLHPRKVKDNELFQFHQLNLF